VTNAEIDEIFVEGVKIGGRKYPYVQIGNQLWLAENLDYKFDGCGIGGSETPSTPHAWYYNNDEATYGIDGTYKCGLLYNWYAVDYLEQNKATLLPTGWHVATKDEWDTLIAFAGGTSLAGTKLKATNNSITSNWPANWNGTDDYGLKILPAGYLNMTFRSIGEWSMINTHTTYGTNSPYYWNFGGDSSVILAYGGPLTARSIRLVKTLT
jgi:uncharacterized protein (TIGR02145 family)